ncbi:hypothetical protein CDD80_3102 [Ophiocordyceps camponoti-rufipedis]|uniref:Uncharacterized protein n=1 Tax=Ophiocordyceps camponoti-rufipedis TaxID=2004952 RepID=A0A2C5Z061_9HYPO|nr:hypothetical protein CDD80_3102 [Ophiocordyceps camponoti-rufipedis]
MTRSRTRKPPYETSVTVKLPNTGAWRTSANSSQSRSGGRRLSVPVSPSSYDDGGGQLLQDLHIVGPAAEYSARRDQEQPAGMRAFTAASSHLGTWSSAGEETEEGYMSVLLSWNDWRYHPGFGLADGSISILRKKMDDGRGGHDEDGRSPSAVGASKIFSVSLILDIGLSCRFRQSIFDSPYGSRASSLIQRI